jgi:ribonuclease PH
VPNPNTHIKINKFRRLAQEVCVSGGITVPVLLPGLGQFKREINQRQRGLSDLRHGTSIFPELVLPEMDSVGAVGRWPFSYNRPMNPQGNADFFRPGDRKPNQLRPLTLTPGFVQTAEGSVLVTLGNTRVLTNATIEPGVPGWLRNSGRGWVTAEYAMLPRSTVTRTPRESERGKIGGRTHEIQRLIGRSLRSVVDMQALGERTMILDCDVIQADGGTRTAAITGAAVALAIALNALVKAGTLKQSPLKQLVAATSVGIVGGAPLLDLCYEEDSQAEVDMNIVMTADGGLVETQATAEKGSYSRADLNGLIDLAEGGLKEIFAMQRAVLNPAS